MPTKATITPTCGLTTVATLTAKDMMNVSLDVESACAAIRKIAAELPEVNPMSEMSRRGGTPRLLALGLELCTHTSCPVPSALIKASEIEAGLDLPKPIVIEIEKD